MKFYRTLNLVILGLLFYAVVFALISPALERNAPTLWRCQYMALTGKQCPFCGLTGDLRSFLQNGNTGSSENPLFPVLLPVFICELLLRVLFTVLSFRSSSRLPVRLDGAVHLAGLSALFLL